MTTSPHVPEGFPLTKQAQTGRVWTCKAGNEGCSRTAPCRSCLGRRSRRSGLQKQREARKALGVPDAKFHGQLGNEESWRHGVIWEVKSGRQCGTAPSVFLNAEKQATQNRAIGDLREVGVVLMPTGWGSEGLVMVRLSKLAQVVAALSGEGA